MSKVATFRRALDTSSEAIDMAATAAKPLPALRRWLIEAAIGVPCVFAIPAIILDLPTPWCGVAFWAVSVLFVLQLAFECAGGTEADQRWRFANEWLLVQAMHAHDGAIEERLAAGQSKAAVAEFLNGQLRKARPISADDVQAYCDAVIERRLSAQASITPC